jgi:hypothetical protein
MKSEEKVKVRCIYETIELHRRGWRDLMLRMHDNRSAKLRGIASRENAVTSGERWKQK